MTKTRTTSLALACAALTALSGVSALGQSDECREVPGDIASSRVAIAVAGTSSLVGQARPGTTMLDGDISCVRDNVLITTERASDPRVEGVATTTVNFDAYPDETGVPGPTQVRYGDTRLENESGAWTGHFAGSLANGAFVQTYWLEGEAAYEGLSYVATADGNGDVWPSQGLVFPGDTPSMGWANRLPVDGLVRDLPVAWATPADS